MKRNFKKELWKLKESNYSFGNGLLEGHLSHSDAVRTSWLVRWNTTHAFSPKQGQGESIPQSAITITNPLGFSVLNNKPKNKVSFSAVITLQPCYPKPLLQSGKNFLDASLAAQAKMQKKNAMESWQVGAESCTVHVSICGSNIAFPFTLFSVKNWEKLLPRFCPFKTDGSHKWLLWSGKNQHSPPFQRSERLLLNEPLSAEDPGT